MLYPEHQWQGVNGARAAAGKECSHVSTVQGMRFIGGGGLGYLVMGSGKCTQGGSHWAQGVKTGTQVKSVSNKGMRVCVEGQKFPAFSSTKAERRGGSADLGLKVGHPQLTPTP
jgi:hypothetical protein